MTKPRHQGLPNKQIATALGIHERTVKAHVTSAMNKLGVENRAHAAVAAIQRGYCPSKPI